ncbi:MAG: gamma-butyrobetaine hydroxylase-like domain-containing protein, partial [Pseudomonadota bacterium]|nr:gamma-butyrobetaine hydroxylase-like domain-containing protein [Pseudomonadota bacterium]
MDGNNRYEPWPQEIRVCEEGTMLSLSFDNGEKLSISAELLRVESPSAEVQGHGPNEKTILSG